MRARSVVLLLPLVVFLTACAEPPSKEISQAEGAIDAARAAGADTYAAETLDGATDSLDRAAAAVAERDYRLALNLAIESRERAQVAARQASEAKAVARGNAERIVAEAEALLGRARERVQAPPFARQPRATAAAFRAAITSAEERMQEARAALGAGEYTEVLTIVTGLRTKLQEAIATLDNATAAPAPRRRR